MPPVPAETDQPVTFSAKGGLQKSDAQAPQQPAKLSTPPQQGGGFIYFLAIAATVLWAGGLTAYTTRVTRRATLATRRDELAAMVRALYRALRWIRGTEGAEVARVLAGYFPDVPPALFAGAIDRYRALQLYGPDPVTRREGFDRLAAAMLSGGALKSLIPFEDCVDNSLAEQAVA